MDAKLSAKEKIAQDRKRTNILKSLEQPVIAFLCERIPTFITPDMLTFIGFLGSVMVAGSFLLAVNNKAYLLLGVLGFAIQWFGDSLDGRVAYYRNIPKKWYGFALDMSMDWLSTILIGIGFYYYLPETHRLFVYTFITMYGWTMIIALLKYRITYKYVIDIDNFGPTELRIGLCLILVGEYFYSGTLLYFAWIINAALLIINVTDFYKLLKTGKERDARENAARKNQTPE